MFKYALIVAKLQLLFNIITTLPVMAQRDSFPAMSRSTVTQELLQLSDGVTTILIFAAPICEGCIDRGSPDVITSPVAGVANVLRVKAASDQMQSTNLTVFTSDGRIYSFWVTYQKNPDRTIWNAKPLLESGPAQFTGTMTAVELNENCKVVAASLPQRRRPKAKTIGQMDMRLTNIYLHQGVMFFKLRITNHSAVDYDVDFCRFYVRDRMRKRRTSSMEKPIAPLLLRHSPSKIVPAGGTAYLVMAMDKFTIADNKLFCAEVFETGGDRSLLLKLKGSHLLNAGSF